MLVSLNATIKKLITLDFYHDDPAQNYSVDLVSDKVYEVYFAYEAELIKGVGTIKDIIVENDNFTLVLDCSTNYNSNVIHIRQDLIRAVKEHVSGPTYELPGFEEEGE